MNSPTEVIQQLLLLLYMYSVITQKAFADDPIVFKDFPANVTCRRTREQRLYERNEASTENYRACYDYEIVNEECVVTNPIVDDISPSVVVEDSTKIYRIETPLLVTNMYPKSLVCFFVIGRRRNGFFYQYFQSTLFNQDLEGMLYINDSGTSVEVVGGLCQDFFEFREKQFDNQVPINELVTCSNITDPRIQFEVDVASALTLVFKSNDENEFQGIDFYILEIDPSGFTSKRKKRETEAKQGLKGPIGDTGRRGAPGKQGPAGKIGRDGSNGLKGERGILGIMGPEGDIGLPGEIGMPGDIGPTGPKGMSCTCPSFKNCKPGRPGRKGANGSRGFRGDTGPRGPRGQPGKPGDKGFPGSKGEKGNKGLNGAKGLPGPRGDQGPTGSRGKRGPPGPPGLGGCPLPTNNKLSRRIREVGHIFSTTSELYDSLGLEDQMSADEFYDYIMKNEKDAVPVHLYSDENRAARSTESSTDCSGTLVIPGPKGEPGVPGLPGEDGIKGEAGIPGIDGTSGKAGEPGIPGSRGSKGSRGDKGPRGPKGENGNIGPRGYPGDCQCYRGQGEVITYSQSTSGNGIPGRPGPRGPRGPKGFPGSVGEKGSLGSPGRRGPKGLKGDKGVSGRTGSYGKPGSKGRLGQRGIPGPTGPPGPRGPPGCVCNNLIILLDKYGFVRRNTRVPDLNIFNLARIRPNTKILDLPISDGDWNERTNQSTGLFFKPNITCIRNDFGPAKIGPKGEQGLPGSPGANGDLGIPGMPGRDGIPGIKGKHGDPGLFGVKGEKGLRGKVGSKGVTGVVGRQGLPGNNSDCILGERSQYLIAIECPTGCPNGLDGEIGDRGDPGLKGSSGPRGLRGARGLIGPRGVAGLSGSPGDKGSVGKPGVKGPPGLRGLPGAVGPAGPTGPPGPRNTCPEYDGVDFNMFMSASKKDMEKMKYLTETSNRKVATEMTKEEFPLLRELAKLITKGYRFRRRQPCQPLKAPANGRIRYSRTGTRAYFTCKQGFNVKGEDTLVCQNEKWNSQPPVCFKSTPSLA